jgi:hypothetical protein
MLKGSPPSSQRRLSAHVRRSFKVHGVDHSGWGQVAARPQEYPAGPRNHRGQDEDPPPDPPRLEHIRDLGKMTRSST